MALLLFLDLALPHVSSDYINIDGETLLFWLWKPAATICQELWWHETACLCSPFITAASSCAKAEAAWGYRAVEGVRTAWSRHAAAPLEHS